MKKLIPILVLLISFSSFAQGGERIQERIRAQKVAFITERLNLSVEEAQEFWPIYNAYEAKVDNMKKNDLKEVRRAMTRGNLSESEAQEILDQFLQVEENLFAAKKQLVKDLKNVIPPQKIIQLKVSEDDFNKELLNRLKKMREQRNKRRN